MKFKLILGILFAAALIIGTANAMGGPLTNCSNFVFSTPSDWNTTSYLLQVTYMDGPQFLELAPKTLYDFHNYGKMKSMVGANDQMTGWITINNTDTFHIQLVTIYKPATYTVNNVGAPIGQQQDVNTNPVLGTYDYVSYNIGVDVPVSGVFDENVTLEFEAMGDAPIACATEHFNVTFNVRGTAFPYTFVNSLPPGWIAEWNSTGIDATETDSGSNGDMLVIGTADHVPIVATNVTPNVLTPQALEFGSMTGTIDPATGKSYINFDWATNAPEASPTEGTIHYILVEATGMKSPWVCNSGSISSLNQVVPGCTGYNSAPTYIIQNFYVDGTYTPFFMIETGYSGAGAFGNSSLTVFDEFEGSSVNTDTSATFYAYYYNTSSSSDTITPGEGGSCFIQFEQNDENGSATACSGNWRSGMECSNAYDGNWGTIGMYDTGTDEGIYYVNYTKPSGVTTAKWLVEDDTAYAALTVPAGCMSGSELQFLVNSSGPAAKTVWNCWNYSSSAWITLRSSGSGFIYEESIYWAMPGLYNMASWNGTHYSYTRTAGFPTEGDHNWTTTCNDSTGTFATASLTDDIIVSGIGGGAPSYPEFSDFAWVLAAVLGAGGFVLMRRMRKY